VAVRRQGRRGVTRPRKLGGDDPWLMVEVLDAYKRRVIERVLRRLLYETKLSERRR
jgi:hypothetical protein